MPKVSIVIPTYNSALHLSEAIKSVLAQTDHDREIIVVNDGSTDQTDQVVANFRDQVRYLSHENRGPAAARNTGLRNAVGEYLAFLDADDLFLPDKLRIQSSYLDQNPNIGVIYSNGYLFQTNSQGHEKRQLFSAVGLLNKSLGSPATSQRVLATENAFPVHAALARRDLVLNVGGLDENLPALEDWDLWYRIAASCNFAYLDAVLVKYRTLPTSRSQDRQGVRNATTLLQAKIEASDAFATFSDHTKSAIFLSWGVTYLDYGDPASAIVRFKKAIEYNPANLYARSALWLTRWMGPRAVVFDQLKHRLVGSRRLPGLRSR